MELLRNAVRPYAWGSRTTIPELLGREVPAPHPEAELWMGAHPGDPSRVLGEDGAERSLLELIEADPHVHLGPDCARRWNNRLPFLLKILAVEEPLSMQAHPSAAQSAEGHAREEAAGIPRDAPNRNYPDPTAKPELVCALTEFHALAGFREPGRTIKLLRAVETPGLAKYTELLAAQPDSDGMRALFTTWITLPQASLDELLPEVLDACVLHVKEHGEFDTECRTILELGEAHPRDAGVLAALLLNRLTLRAGEAIYLPAGNLHLYLHGTAVEILANSDNILRGGLTPKHVDVPELLRVVDFACSDMPVLPGEPGACGAVYRTDAPEFELSRCDWAAGERDELRVDTGVPQILLCTAGRVLVRADGGGELELGRGRSIWLPATDPAVYVRPLGEGRTQLFRATSGR
ncbi:mannose-6-phosphate isomerase, class I [Amycolatopsis sp. GM8]|uniref:mannose-6-phosphate isomerase, class I n=1 Tax=Amycolatopsis sp. GM8 TaxID=2896530 RepID=UPI001F028A9B|nr:mannose-6-phosphate isomerase, class I [Amycolatopsis sp. GM8]